MFTFNDVNPDSIEQVIKTLWDLSEMYLMPEDEVHFHFELTDNDNISGPKKTISNNFIIQGLDKDLMENLMEVKLLPYVFELSALSQFSLEPIWKPTSLKSTRHFGYAIQWFALALVVLFGGFYLFKKRNVNE